MLKPVFCFYFFILLFHAGFGQDYVITRYGAVGDGVTNNTKAIQKAIDKCSQTGGRVYFPPGVFITGTLILKSNVTIYLAENSTLKGIPDVSKYPRMKPVDYRSHIDDYPDLALLYAEKQENITITGRGTFHGNGDHPVFQDSIDNSPNRPYGIKMIECRNVEVSNIKMRNSAFWMQLYLACEKVRLTNLEIYNQVNMNNDGIDIDGCDDVVIANCIIDASDDNICLKANGPRSTQNVTVTNCILSTHCYAFKCGTETTGGFKNINVSNIVVRQSKTTVTPKNGKKDVPGFGQTEGQSAIALQIMDGGVMENVNITNFVVDSIETPIFIKLGNRARKHRPDALAPGPGAMRNIRIGNITAKNAGVVGNSITGYPGHYVENVHLYNIDIQTMGLGTNADTTLIVPENSNHYPKHFMFESNLPAYGFYVRHVKNITFDQVQFRHTKPDARAAFVFDDVQEAYIGHIKAPTVTSKPTLILKDASNIYIEQPLKPATLNEIVNFTGETSNVFLGQKLLK